MEVGPGSLQSLQEMRDPSPTPLLRAEEIQVLPTTAWWQLCHKDLSLLPPEMLWALEAQSPCELI